MLKTPAQQLAVATAVPVVLSAGVITANSKNIKKRMEKVRPNCVSTGLAIFYSISAVTLAGAGYASFRVYLRSTFLGPPVSGTSKIIATKANNALIAYGATVIASMAWFGSISKHATTNLLCGLGFLSASIVTFNKFKLIDKVASRYIIPVTLLGVMSASTSAKSYACGTTSESSAFRKKVTCIIKKIFSLSPIKHKCCHKKNPATVDNAENDSNALLGTPPPA